MININLQYYEELPDYITTKELEKYFVELLKYSECSKETSYEEISEALHELAIRQWHTYELLDDNIKCKLEIFISKVWNLNSITLVENLVSVITNLGLEKSFEKIKESLNEDITKETKLILEETIKEIGDSISDPYFGMRKLNN